ncbi:hypothetical protein [Nocardioides humi]|uniref:hypothetical protein n=1 Tax=Nocardioides humi TaxID=449461 RepID=UPI00112CFB38|nr:hypothetical protein [Nocardioides humi]
MARETNGTPLSRRLGATYGGRATFVSLIGASTVTLASVTAASLTLSASAPVPTGPPPEQPPVAARTAPATSDPAPVPAEIRAASGASVRFALQKARPAGTGPDAVPAAAISAYQRAEAVMATASPDCHLSWTLLAGIGHVVSRHGRIGPSNLDDQGVATPAIIGPVVRDENRRKQSDTDAGALDLDAQYDRTVGPMGLSPTAWATVGVDGDADGTRNPQDIDDAALATAVLLCSTGADLGDKAGRTTALAAMNAHPKFAERVRAAARAYRAMEPWPADPPTVVPARVIAEPADDPAAPVAAARAESVDALRQEKQQPVPVRTPTPPAGAQPDEPSSPNPPATCPAPGDDPSADPKDTDPTDPADGTDGTDGSEPGDCATPEEPETPPTEPGEPEPSGTPPAETP